MRKHRPLTIQQIDGCVDILARRVHHKFGVTDETLPEDVWCELCVEFAGMIVKDGRWNLPEALEFADLAVELYLAGEGRKRKRRREGPC